MEWVEQAGAAGQAGTYTGGARLAEMTLKIEM